MAEKEVNIPFEGTVSSLAIAGGEEP